MPLNLLSKNIKSYVTQRYPIQVLTVLILCRHHLLFISRGGWGGRQLPNCDYFANFLIIIIIIVYSPGFLQDTLELVMSN